VSRRGTGSRKGGFWRAASGPQRKSNQDEGTWSDRGRSDAGGGWVVHAILTKMPRDPIWGGVSTKKRESGYFFGEILHHFYDLAKEKEYKVTKEKGKFSGGVAYVG